MSFAKTVARAVSHYDNGSSMGARLRARRLGPLLSMISTVAAEHGRVCLIDIGGTRPYWNLVSEEFLDRHNVRITIVNVAAPLGPAAEGRFTHVTADACDLSRFPDNAFHIAHSNSVIEHVGDWDRMVRFAHEVSRVAARYFVQTPSYWFPLEPHCMTPFFHYLPRPTRVWLTLHFDLGHWRRAPSVDVAVRHVESARLLDKRMLRELFKDARIIPERVGPLTKSFIAVKD
jgi:hypothetical protein